MNTEATNTREETKAEKFKRIGNRRLDNAEAEILKLTKLGNRDAYDYTAEQAQMIVSVLQDAVDKVNRAFFSDDDDEVEEKGRL